MKTALLIALAIFTIGYLIVWIAAARDQKHRAETPTAQHVGVRGTATELFVGFVANFFDTLGIGSFATTSSMFKLLKMVPDGLIPGTLNVGHTLPTVVEAVIFIAIIRVDPLTLACLIASSVAGAWIGAGIVSRWPQQKVRIGLGLCLIAAALLMLASQLNLFPIGSDAEGLTGARLVVGTLGNFILGALMTLGIGLYAPCMILVSLLGMSPKAAFPIMMGSCAFLMPVGSVQFIRTKKYHLSASIGLALGGIPAVFLAAFLVKSLPLSAIRWLVVVVVLYTAGMMLRSAYLDRQKIPAPQPDV
ncbi:MAG TPA: sulfite exporter TauE/SafE family protein [Candidatus Acidoferrales bacterium]|nr:sulfite exporter TauE/SafE family protein [Candidatus Acidoferrales bacterium]